MINKSYKVWIILFIIINSLLLLWSLGYFKFLEENLAIQDNIIIVEPDNQFKKSLPPKDESFPNEKSKVWKAFEDRKNQEQILESNSEAENKNNKIESNKELDNTLENKENKLVPTEKIDEKSPKTSQMLEKNNSLVEKKLKAKQINNNDQTQNKPKNNENLKERNIDRKIVFYVQLASLSKKDLVEKEWNRLKKKHLSYMRDLNYISQKTELKDNRIFFRLLVGRFMSKKEANNFCDNLNISKCIVKKDNE